MLSVTKKTSSDLTECRGEGSKSKVRGIGKSGSKSPERKHKGGRDQASPFMSRKDRRHIFSSPWFLFNARSETWDDPRASRAQDDPPTPFISAQVSPQPSPTGSAQAGGSSRHQKVIARFGTKLSHSVKTGLQRRMKQQPAKNHSPNSLPRRMSLVKSSVQKFTP